MRIHLKTLLIVLLLAFVCACLATETLEESFRVKTGFVGAVEFNSLGDLKNLSGQFAAYPVNSLEDFESRVKDIGTLLEPWLKLPKFEIFELQRIQYEAPDIIFPGEEHNPADHVGYAFTQLGSDHFSLERSLHGYASLKYDWKGNQVQFWNCLVFFTYPETPVQSETTVRNEALKWLNLPMPDSLSARLVLRDITLSPSGERPGYRTAGYFWEVSDSREYMLIDDRNCKLVQKRFNRPLKQSVPIDTIKTWINAVENKLPWQPNRWSDVSFWEDGTLAGMSGKLPQVWLDRDLPLPVLLDSLAGTFLPIIFPQNQKFVRTFFDEAEGHSSWHPEQDISGDPNFYAMSLDIIFHAKYKTFSVLSYATDPDHTTIKPRLDEYAAMDATSKICLSDDYGSMDWLRLEQKADRKFQKNNIPAQLTLFPRQPQCLIDQGRTNIQGSAYAYNVFSKPSDYVLAWKINTGFTDFVAYVDASTGKVLLLNYDLHKLRM